MVSATVAEQETDTILGSNRFITTRNDFTRIKY